MTQGSFMKSIRDNLDKYVDYIVKMCVFYRRFSGYLNHKFDDIYSMKIDSDILGMASATYDCRETVGPVWLQINWTHFIICYRGNNGWII